MAMGRDSCRWVSARLPLLSGGELVGLERRRVERHLLTCAACGQRHHDLADALAQLRAASQWEPIGLPKAGTLTDAPRSSLWPRVAQQIQESRHQPTRRWGAGSPQRLWVRRLGLAASFLVLVSAAVLGLYHFNRKTQVVVRPWPPVIALVPRHSVRPASLQRGLPGDEEVSLSPALAERRANPRPSSPPAAAANLSN